MRKALIVGIDHYDHIGSLNGCVNDAHEMRGMLATHADGRANFAAPKLLLGTGPGDVVGRMELKDAVRALFDDAAEIALLYFSGHGYLEDTGGYLCAGDCRTGDDGLPLTDIMTFAEQSRAQNKVIILDSCHSGIAGERARARGLAEIHEGMTILTASTGDQAAFEENGGGVFTRLLVDALGGAAANLVGHITPGSVYAHIDQSLGPWGGQRPVFKTNVESFVSLREAIPPIALENLRALATHFPYAAYVLPLDPSFEPERSPEQAADPAIAPPDPAKTAAFAVLQRYVRVNLVRPVGAPHMWHAAMQSRGCELTVLGQHYRDLVAKGLI
ncbi:caspase family protein [Sphingomonas bacterium]|uniref:caspase family protein n=1 Tax=Sphingomonas bacterium TaxID=1895847 RepID=UPI001576C629|nr:caspase family protein [Sphingomonas bacterium]